ncbi:MAG: SGNH/GDSL hydrolase family protein [Nitrospirota bacterium]|nr:MAG: SGNH/GDSL hydrolase family protein [Nitrospirota bacterium]
MKKLQMLGIYVLAGAIVLFVVDVVLVVFFGGIKLEFQEFMFRSTTIEFPLVGLLISILCLLMVKGQGRECLLLIFSLMLAGILGEGILRMVDHPLSKPFVDRNTWQEPSDILGFKMAPNFEGIGPVGSWVKTNSRGIRDDVEHQWAKPPGRIRILGVGDSFAFGWGVSLEETFLKKLEYKLKQMTGIEIETINAGVPQWDLNHYYVYLKNIGIRYSPDIILLTYFFNDIPQFIQEMIPADPEYYRQVEYKGGIFRSSALFNFFKAQGDHLRRKNKLGRVDFLSTLEARRPELIQQSTHLLLSNSNQAQTRSSFHILKTLLEKINAIAKKNNSHLVIMFVPDVAQTHHVELQYINQVLASLTEEMHIPFADITPVFESVSDPRVFYFWPRDWHTNAKGHEKMAEALTPLVCHVLQQKNIPCK